MNRHRLSRLALFGLIALALASTGIPTANVQAAAGDLDLTFGNGGKVVTDFFGFHDEMSALAVQPDGKILAAGTAYYADGWPLPALARYNTDGSLDSTFGQGGKRTDMPLAEGIRAMALQSDGKIIIGGAISFGLAGYDFVMERLNRDGSLDTSFANQGIARTDFFRRDDRINAIVIQPDGHIIAAGFAATSSVPFRRGDNFALARYTTDGLLDSSFGIGGKATLDLWGFRDEIKAIALQPDGKLIVAGRAGTPGDSGIFGLARFNRDGTLDHSFGMSGKVITDFIYDDSVVYSLAIQPDGKIVAAGEAYTSETAYDFAVVRYNADGTLDPSFGDGGKVTTDVAGRGFHGNDGARAVLLVNGGRILTAGYTYYDQFRFALVRYTSNGRLDSEFGVGGKLVIDSIGYTNQAEALAMQKDGKVVVGGEIDGTQSQSYHATDFGLLRLIGDFSPFDRCVQDDGNGSVLQVNTTTGEYQFTNCSGLTIGGTGVITKRGNLITLQHNSTDRRVTATFDRAANKATASIQLLSQGRMFTITDRNITNNTCTCR
jgi:uncharacterized delta-60 repeat protein